MTLDPKVRLALQPPTVEPIPERMRMKSPPVFRAKRIIAVGVPWMFAATLFLLLVPSRTFAAERYYYYSIEDRDTASIVRRGTSSTNGLRWNELILRQNTRYRYWLYDAERNLTGYSEFTTRDPGTSFAVPPAPMRLPMTIDTDGDGLPDEVEQFITGSSVTNPDTDGDGIKDGAALQLGLLNRALPPTGVIGSVNTPGHAIDVAAYNDIVVVADSEAGISVFNVFNRMNPVIIAQIPILGSALAVAISGDRVAVAGGAGVLIVDIPANPRVVHQIQLGSARAVTAAGGILFAGFSGGIVAQIDVASGALLNTVTLDGAIEDLALGEEHLYVLTEGILHTLTISGGQLRVVNAQSSPGIVGAGNRRLRLFVGDRLAYAIHTEGYNVFALTNPGLPQLVAANSTTSFGWKQIVDAGSGYGLAAVGQNSVNSGPHDVSLYRLGSNGTGDSFVGTFETPGRAEAVTVYNGLGYVADGSDGLQLLNYLATDVSNRPPTVSLSGSLTMVNPTNATMVEGKLARILANATDDVQVRNVEFYMDGIKAATDGNFPFEFRFVAPPMWAQPSFRIKARASDTGGNATWTEEILVTLLDDQVPPAVIRSYPPTNSVVGQIALITAYFNEPLDSNSVTTAAVEIRSAGLDGIIGTIDDRLVTNGVVSYSGSLNAVLINFGAALALGAYQVTLKAPLADANGVAIPTPLTWRFTVVEGTTVLGAVVDTNGFPVAGATVRIYDLAVSPIVTQADGQFAFSGVPTSLGALSIAAQLTANGNSYLVSTRVNGVSGGNTFVGSLVLDKPRIATSSRISAGHYHSAAIKADGTLWTWGDNTYGQLGNGTTTGSVHPLQIGTDRNWLAVSAGYHHTLALRSDGTMWAWGRNRYGQIGDGLTSDVRSPKQIGMGRLWAAIDTFYDHNLAIASDGSLWVWGYNNSFQLGDGTQNNLRTPRQNWANESWIGIAAGGLHSMALRADGTLMAWGENISGQLGQSNRVDVTNTRAPVRRADAWRSVAAGREFTTAIRSDGTLWAWGDNSDGQVGVRVVDGSRTAPVLVDSNRVWLAVHCGRDHVVALTADGTGWGWGDNDFLKAIDGGYADIATPTLITSNALWIELTAGRDHSMGLRSDGTLWAWGSSDFGQLGNGSITAVSVPRQIDSNPVWSSVAAGSYHYLGIQTNGSLWAWGFNYAGQLGDGTKAGRTNLVQVGSALSWSAADGGLEHTLALTTNGTLYVWGANERGQLGRNSTLSSLDPIPIQTNTSWRLVGGGYLHSVGVADNSALWVWGTNGNAQLGDGSVRRLQPTQVLTNVAWQAAGGGAEFSVALDTAGQLWGWGDNGFGQLGIGDTTNRTSPIQVTAGFIWRSIAVGREHVAAIRSDGTLWSWGHSTEGQLGNGSTTTRNLPRSVSLSPIWASIAAGDLHTVSISTDGRLWSAGDNESGQLGRGTFSDYESSLALVSGGMTWRAVAAGRFITTAVRSDQTLWAWGHFGVGGIVQVGSGNGNINGWGVASP